MEISEDTNVWVLNDILLSKITDGNSGILRGEESLAECFRIIPIELPESISEEISGEITV